MANSGDQTEPQKPGGGTSRILSSQLRLIIGVIVFFIGLVLLVVKLHWYDGIMRWVNSSGVSSAAVYSSFWAILGGVVLLALAISLSPDIEEIRFVLLLAIAGSAVGWILGMYVSPQETSEQQAFAGFKTAVVGVLSGYLLSKFQSIFDKLLQRDAMLSRKFIQRFLFLVIPAFLTMGAVYNVREYKNLTVQIVTKEEVDQGADFQLLQGKDITLEKQSVSRFFADARFPVDSSVTWSIVPAVDLASPSDSTQKVDFGSIAPDGTYRAPDVECAPCFYLVAQSNQDPTKLARRSVKIVKEKNTVPVAAPPNTPSQSNKSQSVNTGQKEKDKTTPVARR
jgi:hypothetical protein